MTVRRTFFAVCSLLGLWLQAGCGAGDNAGFVGAETDDSYYREGQQLEKEGRFSEALNAYLKAIDRRGVSRSPESHLQAAIIYKREIRDPYEAVHYFKKYIEFAAPSRQVTLAREQMDAAKRETLQALPGRLFDDSAGQVDATEQVTRLQRENDALRAELQAVRGNVTPLPSPRSGPAAAGSSLGPSPFPTGGSGGNNAASAAAPGGIVIPGARATAAPAANAQKASAQRASAALPAGSKRHTIKAGDSLNSIARQYYSNNSAASLRAIMTANPGTIPNANAVLRPGTEIVIPPKP